MSKEREFESSLELKREFNRLFEIWSARERLGMSDLAERCGVSLQYLGHVGRYGRIPSKPILTLIALNLSSDHPERLFRAARIEDRWPYPASVALCDKPEADRGLLSVKLDMSGFTTAIQEIVRAELQPKRLSDLLRGRALRVGVNIDQFFMFGEDGPESGLFPSYVKALGQSLDCGIELIEIPYTEFDIALSNGTIDLYGPIYATPKRENQAILLPSFYSVELGVAMRVRESASLEALPAPTRLNEILERGYLIAVHGDSMAHQYLLGGLHLPKDRLVICATPEEAFERIILSGLPRSAHLVVADLPLIDRFVNQRKVEAVQIRWDKGVKVPRFDDTLALRSDWGGVRDPIERAVKSLNGSDTIRRLISKYLPWES